MENMLQASPTSSASIKSEGQRTHHNGIGALRLFFAYAVILSHSPEMLDGNRLREPLIRAGSSNTLGGLAVDGFFIVSGYLIASSYLSKSSLSAFLASRILRIYPAFCIAYLVCMLIVAPLSGGALGTLRLHDWLIAGAKMLFLKAPDVTGAFATLPIPALDGSMWTILYEFRCYLIVGLLGILGWLARRQLVLGLTITLYAVSAFNLVAGVPSFLGGPMHRIVGVLIGDSAQFFPLTAIFMSGVSFRLFRNVLPFRTIPLLAAAALCIACAGSIFSDLIIGVFGTYCLLWLAVGFKSRFLQHVNNTYDYSYGIYLYAWPIASLTILYSRKVEWILSPGEITIVTAILSTIIAMASWYLIERPMLNFKPKNPLVRFKTA